MEPVDKIEPQEWMTSPATAAVMAALAVNGSMPRFVGGCVRDAVLGWKVKDIDIATEEEPETVITALEAAGIKAVPTGIDHGTVTAVTQGAHFEITTLRHDVETFGRRARVAFTDDWVADAARRDFTINALFCDADGTLYDPTGGLEDLREGRVCFVGAATERIGEDVLRLLRFFRIHAHYGIPPPDAEAIEACRAMADRLDTLSAERVWSELCRLLEAPNPAQVLRLMDDLGVLAHLLPEASDNARLAALTGIEAETALPDGLPDALRRLVAVLEADEGGARDIAKRLRLSNAERDRLVALVAPEADVTPALDDPSRRLALFRTGAEGFADLALIGWAGEAAAGKAVDAAGWRGLLAIASDWQVPVLPVSGADVLALSVPRGAEIGKHLRAVELWWIKADFKPGRDKCLKKLKALVGSG